MTHATPLAPRYEITLRTPQGEIRAWIEPDAANEQPLARLSLRLDFAEEGERQRSSAMAVRLAAEISRAVRGLSGVGPAEASAADAPSIGPWLMERIDADPTARTLTRYLFQDYLTWCDRNGVRAVGLADFGREMDHRGFRSAGNIRQGGYQGRSRGGLRLRPEAVATEAAAQSGLSGATR